MPHEPELQAPQVGSGKERISEQFVSEQCKLLKAVVNAEFTGLRGFLCRPGGNRCWTKPLRGGVALLSYTTYSALSSPHC